MVTDTPDTDLAGWEIRPNVSQQALYNLLELRDGHSSSSQGFGKQLATRNDNVIQG